MFLRIHFRVYDSRRPPEPYFPSVHPSLADFIADEGIENEDLTSQDEELEGDPDRLAEIELLHAPPGLVLFSGFQSSMNAVIFVFGRI